MTFTWFVVLTILFYFIRYLSGNELTGSIPPQLGNISGLETLELHNNRLNGTIPISSTNSYNLGFDNLTSLMRLWVAMYNLVLGPNDFKIFMCIQMYLRISCLNQNHHEHLNKWTFPISNYICHRKMSHEKRNGQVRLGDKWVL